MSQPAARLGDMHICPLSDGPKPHVGGPILPPCQPNVLIGGLPAARIGDLATCASAPDTIIQGSATVLIGGKPASRLGDSTMHGGKITVGCPTVLIGGASTGGGGGFGAVGRGALAGAFAGINGVVPSKKNGLLGKLRTAMKFNNAAFIARLGLGQIGLIQTALMGLRSILGFCLDWLTRGRSINKNDVNSLLDATSTGRKCLQVEKAKGIVRRDYTDAEMANKPNYKGHYDPNKIPPEILLKPVSADAKAKTLVHELTHAQQVPVDVREYSREEYLDRMYENEVEANLASIRFANELRKSGVMSPVEDNEFNFVVANAATGGLGGRPALKASIVDTYEKYGDYGKFWDSYHSS